MYCVSCYSYETKKHEMIAFGSRNNMTEYIETWIMNYIDSMQGTKYKSFDECLRKSGKMITSKEWDNDIRYFVTRSNNNMSKYVIMHMVKTKGYMYSSRTTEKVKTVYLIKNSKYKKVTTERRSSDFEHHEELDNVLKDLVKFVKDNTTVEIDIVELYGNVIKELKRSLI